MSYFPYHAFLDKCILGIYDMSEHLHQYNFPNVNGKKVLDLGCASGYFSRYFARNGAEVVAYDISTGTTIEVLEIIEKTLPDYVPLNIVNQNVFAMKYKDEFDLIFCGSLLMHVFYPMHLLRLIHIALKPGGKTIVATARIDDPTPTIRCDPHLGGDKILAEISSSNESLWWFSEKAIQNVFAMIGFTDFEVSGKFTISSTDYGKSIGHNYSTPHLVVHGTK